VGILRERLAGGFFKYLNTSAASLAPNILNKCLNDTREVLMTRAAPSPFCRQTPQLSDLLGKTTGIISDLGLQFLQYGEGAKITIEYEDGRPADEFSGFSSAERSAFLAGFVTEKSNPKNKPGVAEVQVELSASILTSGVVLIDTPGIGSTYRHNTFATLNLAVFQNNVSPASEPKAGNRRQPASA
jgi:hypothetical protein